MRTIWQPLSAFVIIVLTLDLSSLKATLSEWERLDLGIILLQATVSERIWQTISFFAADILQNLKEASIGAINLRIESLLGWENLILILKHYFVR